MFNGNNAFFLLFNTSITFLDYNRVIALTVNGSRVDATAASEG